MSIDLISIIIFLGIGQCLFLMVVILADKRRLQPANIFLFLLLTAFLWYQTEFFLLRHKLDASIPFLYSTRYGSWLLVGPLLLLYNRATLVANYRPPSVAILHFVPFVILTLVLPLFVDNLVTDRAHDYGMLTVFDAYNREPISWKHYLYGYIFLVQFLHVGGYIFWAYRETQQLEKRVKQTDATLPQARINTLKLLYLLAAIMVGLCSAFVFYIFSTTMWLRTMDYFYVIPLLILVYGLAYRAIKHPDSVFALPPEEIKVPEAKYARSSLRKKERKAYLRTLENLIEEEQLYRDNELRLSSLAEKLGVSTHHLSEIINQEKNQNFFDFVNGYRIREAKKEIEGGRWNTLLEVAFHVGFNSKNAFNNAFKKHVGMTPSAFKKQKQPNHS